MPNFSKIKTFGELCKAAAFNWIDHDPFRSSMVVSYCTVFALPGLLIVIINLVGYFFGEKEVTEQIKSQIQSMIGHDAANYVETIIANASEHENLTLSSAFALATILFGATGVFFQMQKSLNIIWGVEPQPKRKFLKLIIDRVFSFGLILTVGFLLLVSLVLSAVLTAINDWVATHWSPLFNLLFRLLDVALSLGVVTLLFAAIYKFLPDVIIRWRDVFVGALLTATLFVLAEIGLGLYFGHSDPGSTYGAAGSVILIMLWVTYAGLIFTYGAEFTQVYAERIGASIKPAEYAVPTKYRPHSDSSS